MIADSAGNLYGTTSSDGTFNGGVVYEINSEGQETILYNFTGGLDGCIPDDGLAIDSAGNLYGTASECGEFENGVVFKLDRTGKESVLYSFAGGSDGAWPVSGVTFDSAGNLYGTTTSGGTENAGVVYQLNTVGQETVLYTFTGGVDGDAPGAGVVRDSAGIFTGPPASEVFMISESCIRSVPSESKRCFIPFPAKPMEGFPEG